MKQYIAILIFLLSACSATYAQVDRRDVRKGNRDFRKENFKEADISYRKALVKDSMSVAANYNLASTLYRMGDMQQAASTMERIREVAPASEHGADYHYNMGDIALASENYQAAVDAFRQALLLNPGDMDAKENYIYAKKKLQDQQNQQNQNQDNQNKDTLDKLKSVINEKYKGAIICGMMSPPFRPLTVEEDEQIIKEINEANPDFIWVGLGAPKQEIWMAAHENKISGLMIGVGAAFDYESGNIKRAPKWMQKLNLEWLYRLLQDPKRLLPRYIKTNSKFLIWKYKDGRK